MNESEKLFLITRLIKELEVPSAAMSDVFVSLLMAVVGNGEYTMEEQLRIMLVDRKAVYCGALWMDFIEDDGTSYQLH